MHRLLACAACLVTALVVAPLGPTVSRAFPIATSTPPPSAVPTASESVQEITDLWASSDGTRSGTVYAGRRTDLTIAYRFGTGASTGAHWATFEVLAHGATVVRARTMLGEQRVGTVVYHLTNALPTGRLQFRGVLAAGSLVTSAHRQIVSLDPRAFLLSTSPGGGLAKLRVSRIETTSAALREKFVLSPGGSTLQQLGRQNGTFQSVRLSWPGVDASQVAVQARLVSMFGSARAARAAFRQRVAQYRLDEACRSSCARVVRPRTADATLGQDRAAFVVDAGLDVHVTETIFLRGHLIAEMWTYSVGTWTASAANALAGADAGTAHALDTEATQQQTR